MAVARPKLTLPVTATATITLKLFVTAAGAICGAGAKALGVSLFNTDTGNEISVVTLGTAIVIASDAISADADVTSDAAGKAITATTGDIVLGRALEAAAATDDEIEVLLTPSGIKKPA